MNKKIIFPHLLGQEATAHALMKVQLLSLVFGSQPDPKPQDKADVGNNWAHCTHVHAQNCLTSSRSTC